jgi:hypothetical protein
LGAPVILDSSYFSAVDLISNQAASLLPLLARLPPSTDYSLFQSKI